MVIGVYAFSRGSLGVVRTVVNDALQNLPNYELQTQKLFINAKSSLSEVVSCHISNFAICRLFSFLNPLPICSPFLLSLSLIVSSL